MAKAALGMPGKGVQALIIMVGAAYLLLHASFAVHLFDHEGVVSGVLLVTALVVATANLFMVVPVWVYGLLTLVRGPKALVDLPVAVPDDALPEIVVQVPGRNEPLEAVRRSIDSVLEADYPAHKIRVQFIDNSDDQRWKLVAAHYCNEPRVRVEHRDGTRGFKGGNLNIGLERLGTFGDPARMLIGLLDVGDTFAPKALRPMATEFVHDARLGFVQGMFRIGNPRESVINWSDSYVGDAARRFTEGYMAHYGIPTMNGHCALLRLQALDQVGRWNEDRVAEDWSTGITMVVLGWRGKWVDYVPNDPDMVSTELVPSDIGAQQKQKRRWATGGTELAKLHLVDWMRADIPWHQRMALLFRLGANFSVLPAFILQMMLPVWVALIVLGDSSSSVATFGLLSTLAQSPFMFANTVAAFNYAREGQWRKAAVLVVAYPVQALWRLPLFAHAALGIIDGLHKGLKEFVITPKTRSSDGVVGSIRSQSFVVAVSVYGMLPLALLGLARPAQAQLLVMAGAVLPLLTIFALLLVPITQWARAHIRRSNPADPSV